MPLKTRSEGKALKSGSSEGGKGLLGPVEVQPIMVEALRVQKNALYNTSIIPVEISTGNVGG
jgi:hypothetical protein